MKKPQSIIFKHTLLIIAGYRTSSVYDLQAYI